MERAFSGQTREPQEDSKRREIFARPPSTVGSETTDSQSKKGRVTKTYRIEPPLHASLGGTGARSVEAASAAGSTGFSIRPIGAAPETAPMMPISAIMPWMNPVHGLHILQATKKPSPFSGKHGGDWQQFVREWKPYERILEQSYPSELWNTVKIETLKGLLDKSTLADFQAKFEANGGVTFADFWDEIDCEFGRDATHQNRTAWVQVDINKVGSRMTSTEWRAFVKEFILRRNRVDDRTESEEYDLLMRKLPPYWVNEVAKEEGRKNRKGRGVKITNQPPEMTKADLIRLLGEDLGCTPKRVLRADNGYMVSFEEEEDRTQLLRQNGVRIDGRPLGLSRARMKLTSAEIFSYITDRLQTEEEAEMRQSRRDPKGWGGGMHAVEKITPPREERVSVVAPQETENPAPKPSEKTQRSRSAPPPQPPSPRQQYNRSEPSGSSNRPNPVPPPPTSQWQNNQHGRWQGRENSQQNRWQGSEGNQQGQWQRREDSQQNQGQSGGNQQGRWQGGSQQNSRNAPMDRRAWGSQGPGRYGGGGPADQNSQNRTAQTNSVEGREDEERLDPNYPFKPSGVRKYGPIPPVNSAPGVRIQK